MLITELGMRHWKCICWNSSHKHLLEFQQKDNGFSPAHFFFGDDEEEWEELEEVFLLLLFAMYMEERKIKWHHE